MKKINIFLLTQIGRYTKLPDIVTATDSKIVGARLRDVRVACRISQTDFALLLGIGGPRLASYEQGRVPFNEDLLPVARERVLQHLAKATKFAAETFDKIVPPFCSTRGNAEHRPGQKPGRHQTPENQKPNP